MNFDGNKIRRGYSSGGEILANLDGNRVRKGYSSGGDIIANVEGGSMSGAAAAVFLLLM